MGCVEGGGGRTGGWDNINIIICGREGGGQMRAGESDAVILREDGAER